MVCDGLSCVSSYGQPSSALAWPAALHAGPPASAAERREVVSAKEWHAGCPVTLSQLLAAHSPVPGFDGYRTPVSSSSMPRRRRCGSSGVRTAVGDALPIHHMALSDTQWSFSRAAATATSMASFECRQVASPCTSTASTGTGLVGARLRRGRRLNPVENPRGCGMTRDRTALVLPRPLACGAACDARRGPGLPGRGLGLGRLVDRLDQGLHALLRHGWTSTIRLVPSPREILDYMRTARGAAPSTRAGRSRAWWRHRSGTAAATRRADSPLTLQDVIASEDYRNLMTAKVTVGDRAPEFELARIDGAGVSGSLRSSTPSPSS